MEKEKNSRMVDLIVIHCSATKETLRLTPLALDRMHRQRGFNGCGYHYYIERDGKINSMRPSEKVGAHARGYNAHSLGICYEGGLDKNGRAADTRTERQKVSLRALVKVLRQLYPTINRVVGHRDLSADRNGDGVITPDEWTWLVSCRKTLF